MVRQASSAILAKELVCSEELKDFWGKITLILMPYNLRLKWLNSLGLTVHIGRPSWVRMGRGSLVATQARPYAFSYREGSLQ